MERPVVARLASLALLLAFLCCVAPALSKPRTYGAQYPLRTMEKANKIFPTYEKLPQLWEISTRPWLYALSLKYNKNITKLSQIPDSEFQDIRNKGMDIVWMMGLWQVGTCIIVVRSSLDWSLLT